MCKDSFSIKRVDKLQAADILMKYHYLKDISRGFKSGYNYGLFLDENLVGVIIYTSFPVAELAKGMLGLERNNQHGLFELSRLCLHPDIQKTEHNLASWFVSKTIKLLRKDTNVNVILSYADADHHSGIVYAACNFLYFGKTEQKKDFFILNEDGSYKKHTRGKVKGVAGEWQYRSIKHRFALVFNKNYKILWDAKKWQIPIK